MPPAPPANSFARQAALFSFLAPFIGAGINFLGHQAVQGNRVGLIILGCIGTLFVFAGFVLGIMALIGTRKHGTRGILGRAIAGICINGIIICLMLIAIPGFKRAAELAKEQQQQGMEQQPPQP
jgi:hypothetical protein